MPVNLIVVGGMHNGRRIPIRVEEFLIGRDPTCHLRPSSKEIQWQHCAIVTRDGGLFLRDDSSGNGVFLNRRLLRGGEMQIEDGDVIEVGPLMFRVKMSGQELAPARERQEEEQTPLHAGHEVAADDTRIRGRTPLPPTARSAIEVKPMRDAREILCS
jgi:predicted component of type VI protein secretion system